jgi:DNA mismatch repair protein MutL
VSHFTLRTRARGADSSGTEIRVQRRARRVGRRSRLPEGTLHRGGDLFYNLPARRKFLKSDAAEARRSRGS